MSTNSIVMNLNQEKSSDKLILFSFPKERAIKYILVALSCWILALVVHSIPDLDHQILLLFNDARANDQLFASFWYFYTKNMPSFLGIFILGLYLASFKVARLKPFRMALLVAIVSYALGSPLVDQLKVWVNRPRPFLTYPDINTLYEAGHSFRNSFPSGHAFVAFAETLALTIALITKDNHFKPTLKKYIAASLLLIIAVSMALSRVFAGVHYLTDLLGAIGLAIILNVAIIAIFQKALEKKWLTPITEKIIAIVFMIIVLALNTIVG